MYGREIRVPLDVMMGDEESNESQYRDFVADLEDHLTEAYREVRVQLGVAQRRQKEAYDKGIKETQFKPGDRVLLFNPHLQPGEASKFHRLWAGPYIVKKRVTDVTYTRYKRKITVELVQKLFIPTILNSWKRLLSQLPMRITMTHATRNL